MASVRQFSRESRCQPHEQAVNIGVKKPDQPDEVECYQYSLYVSVDASESDIKAYLAQNRPDWELVKVGKRGEVGKTPTSYATQEIWGW